MGSSSKASTSNDRSRTKTKSKLRFAAKKLAPLGSSTRRSADRHLSSRRSASPAEEDKPLPPRDYNQIKQQKELELLLTARRLSKRSQMQLSPPYLQASGLPTTIVSGQEKMATWKRRHARWTLLWNVNIDLSPDDASRKTLKDLKKELREWERTMDREVKTVIDPAAHNVRLNFFRSTLWGFSDGFPCTKQNQYDTHFRTLTRTAALSRKERPKAEVRPACCSLLRSDELKVQYHRPPLPSRLRPSSSPLTRSWTTSFLSSPRGAARRHHRACATRRHRRSNTRLPRVTSPSLPPRPRRARRSCPCHRSHPSAAACRSAANARAPTPRSTPRARSHRSASARRSTSRSSTARTAARTGVDLARSRRRTRTSG